MGNTCTPMADSCQCMANHYNIVISLQLKFKKLIYILKIVKVAQLCLTLCNCMDYTVHGILQAKILEWVAILFSRGSSQSRDQIQVSCIAGKLFTI